MKTILKLSILALIVAPVLVGCGGPAEDTTAPKGERPAAAEIDPNNMTPEQQKLAESRGGAASDDAPEGGH